MRIITPSGEVVAEGKHMKYVRVAYGIQNIDGSHMEPRTIYEVPDWFGVQIVGGHRGHEATAEEYTAQQQGAAPVPVVDPTAIVNGDPAVVNGDPKPSKKK